MALSNDLSGLVFNHVHALNNESAIMLCYGMWELIHLISLASCNTLVVLKFWRCPFIYYPNEQAIEAKRVQMTLRQARRSTLFLVTLLLPLTLNSAMGNADVVNTRYRTKISCPNDGRPWTEKFKGYLRGGGDKRYSGVLGEYYSHDLAIKVSASGQIDYNWIITQQKPGKKKDYWKLKTRQKIGNGNTRLSFKAFFYFTGVRDRSPCTIDIAFDRAPVAGVRR
jgi:hypothetical protein